jgi:hypothetical protein
VSDPDFTRLFREMRRLDDQHERLIEALLAARRALLGWDDNGSQMAHALQLADAVLGELGVLETRPHDEGDG